VERTRKFLDGSDYYLRFCAARTFHLANPLLELTISCLKDIQNIVYVRPGVMFAFVPAFGAQFQCLIIAIFILFDKTFKADITAHIISKMVRLKEKEQSRYPSIPISEGMNTEEVEVEGSHGDERMNPSFFKALLPHFYEFLYE
jgi:hypothetical protein